MEKKFCSALLSVFLCLFALVVFTARYHQYGQNWRLLPTTNTVIRPQICPEYRVRDNIQWRTHIGDLPSIKTKRSCQDIAIEILEQHKIDTPPPPTEVPLELYDKFTLNKTITVKNWYSYEKHTEDNKHWTKDIMAKQIDDAINNCQSMGNYPGACVDVNSAFESYPISNKSGYIVGSEKPWAEGVLLANGAKHLTTIEYGKIISDDPRITIISPIEMATKLLDNTLPKLDFVFSFSTIEHIGLGRYGDPLDPDGDLKVVEQIRNCMLKPGGLLYLGFGVGKDLLCWNVHRIYSEKRLKYILSGWKFLGIFGSFHFGDNDCDNWWQQPVIVLQNMYDC